MSLWKLTIGKKNFFNLVKDNCLIEWIFYLKLPLHYLIFSECLNPSLRDFHLKFSNVYEHLYSWAFRLSDIICQISNPVTTWDETVIMNAGIIIMGY